MRVVTIIAGSDRCDNGGDPALDARRGRRWPSRLLELPSAPTSSCPILPALAIGTVPDYVGSSDYIVGTGAVLRAWAGEISAMCCWSATSSPQMSSTILGLGPAPSGLLRFGRNDVENNQVDKMRTINPTVELGAFAGAGVRQQGGSEDPL